MQTNRCEGVGGINADAFETCILEEMVEHVKEFETLTQPQMQRENPKIHEINVKLEGEVKFST